MFTSWLPPLRVFFAAVPAGKPHPSFVVHVVALIPSISDRRPVALSHTCIDSANPTAGHMISGLVQECVGTPKSTRMGNWKMFTKTPLRNLQGPSKRVTIDLRDPRGYRERQKVI